LLALLGVSVQTAVILFSYINKLRREGRSIREAPREAALLRRRPIMMTALAACLGLLPAAVSTGRRQPHPETVRHRRRVGAWSAAWSSASSTESSPRDADRLRV